MAVETDEDRAALLADFGDDVVITPVSSGTPQPAIVAMFEGDYVAVSNLGLEREISDTGPTLLCRRTDVVGVVAEDGVEILTGEGAGVYSVSDVRPAWGDGAFLRLILDAGAIT